MTKRRISFSFVKTLCTSYSVLLDADIYVMSNHINISDSSAAFEGLLFIRLRDQIMGLLMHFHFSPKLMTAGNHWHHFHFGKISLFEVKTAPIIHSFIKKNLTPIL